MVGAVEKLVDFLPGPFAAKQGDRYVLARAPKSIGQMKAFYGNFGVIVRGYVYVRMLGAEGMRRVAENAVLNANYLKVKVEKDFPVKYPRRCMHEFVAMGDIAPDIHTLDVAKRLIDLGIHPPTIYFPLIVPEAIMVEPTETESREALDDFAAAMHQIAEEAKKSPELLHNAPTTTPVGRLDEVAAARCPVLCYRG
jgi:glycine dehydrogenase subunit 2